MSKKKTFEQAKKEIAEKYPYLKLLEFFKATDIAIFIDKEFGEFSERYDFVKRGAKKHPERTKLNRKKAITKEVKEKRKQTCLKKYGTENPQQNKEIKEKTNKTVYEKYGVKNISQSKKIKNKKIESSRKKFNCDYIFQSEEIKEKIRKTNLKKYGVEYNQHNKYIKEKSIKTFLKRYGVENPFQSEEIKKKIKQTNLNKYGKKNPFQVESIKEKIKQINLKRYGVKNPSQNKDIYNKIKQTNLEKYGVEQPAQSKNIKQKIIISKIKNNICYNIDGISLMEFYIKSSLNKKVHYSTVQRNYKMHGNKALDESHYNELYGKSKIANLWLEQIEKKIGYELIREYHIYTTRYHSDGYDPKTNTVYEFYGDYWHGNLEKFSATNIHPVKGITYKELYNNTIKKENKIKSLGYNLIYIWENDFNK